MFANNNIDIDKLKEKLEEEKKQKALALEEEKMWARRFDRVASSGFPSDKLIPRKAPIRNRYIGGGYVSEDNSDVEEDLFDSFVASNSEEDSCIDMFESFIDKEKDDDYITDWDALSSEVVECISWEDYIKKGITVEEICFVKDFCAQAGLEANYVAEAPSCTYTSDVLTALLDRRFVVRDKNGIVTFAGIDDKIPFFSCDDYDHIKDGDTFGIVEVYREPSAEVCYPFHCSNGNDYMVEIVNGKCHLRIGRGMKYDNYYRLGKEYYHRYEHMIFMDNNAYNIKSLNKVNGIRGAIIDCGVKKYKYSIERVIDAKVVNNEILTRDKEVIGITDVQDGNYEFKTSSEGISPAIPFKAKYNHIQLVTFSEYMDIRTQCTHIKNVMRLIPNIRSPCNRKTLKHSHLMKIIKECYARATEILNVDDVRMMLHKKHAFYDSKCLHIFLLYLGFNYVHGKYKGRYIIKLKRSCARVKWMASRCTCDEAYNTRCVGVPKFDKKNNNLGTGCGMIDPTSGRREI